MWMVIQPQFVHLLVEYTLESWTWIAPAPRATRMILRHVGEDGVRVDKVSTSLAQLLQVALLQKDLRASLLLPIGFGSCLCWEGTFGRHVLG
jgi:hypothetical protein